MLVWWQLQHPPFNLVQPRMRLLPSGQGWSQSLDRPHPPTPCPMILISKKQRSADKSFAKLQRIKMYTREGWAVRWRLMKKMLGSPAALWSLSRLQHSRVEESRPPPWDLKNEPISTTHTQPCARRGWGEAQILVRLTHLLCCEDTG